MQQEEIDEIKGYRKTKDIWDFFEESDARRAARSRLEVARDAIYRGFCRLWSEHLHPSALKWKAIAFFQRRLRGFDDSELWSLDDTILRFILPRLKRFRIKARMGWPGPEAIFDIRHEDFQGLPPEEQRDIDDRSLEEWDQVLDKMIRALELQIEYSGLFLIPNPEWKEGDHRRDKCIESPELKAEYEEGWALFIKWFHALWD